MFRVQVLESLLHWTGMLHRMQTHLGIIPSVNLDPHLFLMSSQVNHWRYLLYRTKIFQMLMPFVWWLYCFSYKKVSVWTIYTLKREKQRTIDWLLSNLFLIEPSHKQNVVKVEVPITEGRWPEFLHNFSCKEAEKGIYVPPFPVLSSPNMMCAKWLSGSLPDSLYDKFLKMTTSMFFQRILTNSSWFRNNLVDIMHFTCWFSPCIRRFIRMRLPPTSCYILMPRVCYWLHSSIIWPSFLSKSYTTVNSRCSLRNYLQNTNMKVGWCFVDRPSPLPVLNTFSQTVMQSNIIKISNVSFAVAPIKYLDVLISRMTWSLRSTKTISTKSFLLLLYWFACHW